MPEAIIIGWCLCGPIALWLDPPYERWSGAYLAAGLMALAVGPILLLNLAMDYINAHG